MKESEGNLNVTHKGWVCIDWALDSVPPRMIDWFWNNMGKGFALWHPI
ncbi:MAG: hypothetical protein ABSG40_06805 [Terriglobales bacterium]|jgi:hypothetical protein